MTSQNQPKIKNGTFTGFFYITSTGNTILFFCTDPRHSDTRTTPSTDTSPVTDSQLYQEVKKGRRKVLLQYNFPSLFKEGGNSPVNLKSTHIFQKSMKTILLKEWSLPSTSILSSAFLQHIPKAWRLCIYQS